MTALAMTADPLFLAFQGAVAGRYSIDRELGRGGMGVVYLAREVGLDRLVAIKVLPPALASRAGTRERFLREARHSAKLSHPHIIPIHAVEDRDDFVFYVMAFVDGETLAERVRVRGPLTGDEATRVLREVAWALAQAHAQGIVHRDVKPDNILLERESGRALVGDFGIAAAAGDSVEDTGEGPIGTPEFMSPEQAMSGAIDARSDLYSLGVTAFFALTGRLPFTGHTTSELLARVVTEAAPTVESTGVRVPRRLSSLIASLLEKSPDARPARADVVADTLGVALEQRRQLPAALRAFAKRDGRMDGMGSVLGLVGTLSLSIAVSTVAGVAGALATIVTAVPALTAAFGVLAARRLLNQGFAHADLRPAFQAEAEIAREERHGALHPIRAAAERAIGAVTRVAATTTAALLPFAILSAVVPGLRAVAALAVTGIGATTFLTLGWLAVMQRRRDVDIEFWGAVWTGRAGAFAFALARRWRGARAAPVAMTHRATELSLGLAAESLFASLPAATRQSLAELPATLARLQRDATRLRARDAQLAMASADDPSSRDERAAVHARLRETVGAMETLRLGLLRLHAGSLSLESLTTSLGLAAELSADMDRLAEAQQEVDDAIAFPAIAALTPV